MTGPVLVTGAAGFAGSHLVERLAGRGELVAWRLEDGPAPAWSPGDVRWVSVNLLDAAAVHAAIADTRPSRVYHCAGAPHIGDAWQDASYPLATNVLGTVHVLEALRRAGVASRVLVTSSAMVYRSSDVALDEDAPVRPDNPYALSKVAQEQAALHAFHEDGIDVVLVRAFNHTGPRQAPSFVGPGIARQIARIEAGLAPPAIAVGNLSARRDLTDVRDTVGAYERLMEHGRSGAAYNVCSGQAHPIAEVVETLVARARVPVEIRVDPERYRPNDTPVLLGNPARLIAETGWHPSITFEQMLTDVLDDWRARVKRETIQNEQ